MKEASNLAFYTQSTPVKENTNSRQLTVTADSTITRNDLLLDFVLDFKAFYHGIICEVNFFGELYLALKLSGNGTKIEYCLPAQRQ